MKTQKITIPHNFDPRDYQLEFLRNKARFKIAVFHRRGGKSVMVFNEQVRKAQIKKGVYYYILPTYKQAKQVIWDEMVEKHVPLDIVSRKNDSELAIYYKNGSIQRFVGADNPDNLRGINPIDAVFDEYSEMKEEMWTAIIQPVLRENKGTATFIFTPKGTNHAYKLLYKAREDDKWFTQVQSVDDTGAIDVEELEQAKKDTPRDFFEQEYYCKFLDGASQFFKNIDQCIRTDINTNIKPIYKYLMGVDLAKHQDYTAITLINLHTFEVEHVDRFNQMDYTTQKAKIEALYRRYNKPLIWMDATGVGDPIYDDLVSMGLNVEPYKFTKRTRKDLLTNLQIKLEQGIIKIPDNQTLIDELKSFKYEQVGSKLKIKVPEGMHDDTVFSLGLAVWELPQKPINLNTRNILNLTTKNKKIGITRYD